MQRFLREFSSASALLRLSMYVQMFFLRMHVIEIRYMQQIGNIRGISRYCGDNMKRFLAVPPHFMLPHRKGETSARRGLSHRPARPRRLSENKDRFSRSFGFSDTPPATA